MAVTVLQLVTSSLRRLGVIGEEQTPTASQGQIALYILNDYINDQLTNDRLAIFTITRTVWTIASGTASYTVGTGGTINIPRPATMNMQGSNVSLIDTASSNPSAEIPLESLTDDAYQAIPEKSESSTYPTGWYYNPTYTSAAAPYATLTLWPVPNVSTLQGVFYAPQAAQEFTSLSQTIALPPGYRRLLRDNLAVELAPEFQTSASEELKDSAREAKASVLSANTRIQDLVIDLALTPQRQSNNIYTGQ